MEKKKLSREIQYEHQPTGRPNVLFAILKVVVILGLLAALVFGVYCEFNNLMTLAMDAGRGFDTYHSALTFSYVFVAGPLFVVLLMEVCLYGKTKQRFLLGLIWTGLVLMATAIALFAAKFGIEKTNVDLVADLALAMQAAESGDFDLKELLPEPETSGPAFYVVAAIAMLTQVVVTLIVPILIGKALGWQPRSNRKLVETERYAAIKQGIDRVEAAAAHNTELVHHLEWAWNNVEADVAAHVTKYLGAVAKYRLGGEASK